MKVVPVTIRAPPPKDALASLIWRGPIWRRFSMAA
jgi:hypothetical protein